MTTEEVVAKLPREERVDYARRVAADEFDPAPGSRYSQAN
jgi:hypothetical protein